MPNRILRDGILTSPRVAKLGWAEEVFYRRLMSVVDDFGRYYADPGMLRAACYPRQLSKVTDPDVGKWTRILVEAGLVRVYRALDRESYVELLDFRQQARAKASKFPAPADEPSGACIADAAHIHSNRIADAPVVVYEDEDEDGGVDEARKRARVEVPDWMPPQWTDYCAYRKARKGWTAKAEALCIRELSRLRDAGHDPAAVIEQSIRNGWAGVFPLKADRPVPGGKLSVVGEQSARILAEWVQSGKDAA